VNDCIKFVDLQIQRERKVTKCGKSENSAYKMAGRSAQEDEASCQEVGPIMTQKERKRN
jgi:hypothetical protein